MAKQPGGHPVETHLREPDAFTWRLERDALLRSVAVGVVVLRGAPDWGRLSARVARASAAVAHFRDRVVDSPLPLSAPQWVPDDRFDLGYHLRRVQAPAPHTVEAVLDLAATAAMTPFDPARPLWEFTLVEGLAEGRAAVVLKVHHGLTDGVGAVQLALNLFDVHPDAESDTPPLAPSGWSSSHPGLVERTLGAVAHELDRAVALGRQQTRLTLHAVAHPLDSVRSAVATAASVGRFVAPVTETRSPVMRERTLSRRFQVIEIPVVALRDAAKAVHAELTLNDAYLAAVLDGVRRYHEHHDAAVDELHVTIPISVRTATIPPAATASPWRGSGCPSTNPTRRRSCGGSTRSSAAGARSPRSTTPTPSPACSPFCRRGSSARC